MGNKSTLEKYRSKEELKSEERLGREDGRTVFNIRAGSLGLRNRTGRTAQKCTGGGRGDSRQGWGILGGTS